MAKLPMAKHRLRDRLYEELELDEYDEFDKPWLSDVTVGECAGAGSLGSVVGRRRVDIRDVPRKSSVARRVKSTRKAYPLTPKEFPPDRRLWVHDNPKAYVIPQPENTDGMTYGNFRHWLAAHLGLSEPVRSDSIQPTLKWRHILYLSELNRVDANTLRMPDGLVEEIWEDLQKYGEKK